MARRHPKAFSPCAHCRRRPGDRPRGLCSTCYYTPAVRALYPAVPPAVSGAIGGNAKKRREAA